MVHISIWVNFQTWHWTKWTSLVDRLHWSIPIKAKGYLQRDQFSAVPLKKCCFFCFCLFLCIFCRSSHLIEGCEEALFCGLTHSKDRKTVHLKIQNITERNAIHANQHVGTFFSILFSFWLWNLGLVQYWTYLVNIFAKWSLHLQMTLFRMREEILPIDSVGFSVD